jgi:putative FmdB family regulatory protein
MPMFEYRCTDCGREFEAFVTGERKAECPACRGANLAKQLSSPGMVGAAGARREPAQLPMSGGCGGACACKH